MADKNSTIRLLQDIARNSGLSLNALARGYGLSRTQLRYRLERLNEFLTDRGLPGLELREDRVWAKFSWEELSRLLRREDGRGLILDSLNSQMRRAAEAVYLFCGGEGLSVFHFQSAFQISKNTVVEDLKQVRRAAGAYEVSLRASRQCGYFFSGDGTRVRNFLLDQIDVLGSIDLLSCIVATVLRIDGMADPAVIAELLTELLRREGLRFWPEYLNRAACLIALLLLRDRKAPGPQPHPGTGRAWELTRELSDRLEETVGAVLPPEEEGYVTLLLGYLALDGDLLEPPFDAARWDRPAGELAARFCRLMNLPESAGEAVRQPLRRRLQFLAYCTAYRFPVVYPKLLELQQMREDSYHIVGMLAASVPALEGLDLGEGAVAFLTAEFCRLQERPEEPDQREAESVEGCLKCLEAYCDLRQREALTNLLRNLTAGERRLVSELLSPPPLEKVLLPEFVRTVRRCADWKAALTLAAQPLLQCGYVTPAYGEQMISLTQSRGAYAKVYPEILIPHAGSQEVDRLGFSLLQLQEPVYLLDSREHPIRVIIVAASPDNQLHRRALGRLADLLSQEEIRRALLTARTPEQILALLYP